ncbi:hypothetical protein AMATHDRAFT_43580 [Amanita thiersii Skay4041]|uniref:Uncharacterized protein n=1 Tax=Amanita thiersii Skay4041 TaxID=703135 RepID=A0A2A9NAY6_9AGAR|nr:hypothetical protein AMATHDRAFT_43580 [Amanita thiersii Skay4041]
MAFQNILNRLSATSEYAILPTSSNTTPKQDTPHPSCWSRVSLLPKRYTRILFALFIALVIYVFAFPTRAKDWTAFPSEAFPTRDGMPPLYKQYREWEAHLPAHNPSLPYPDGKHAKFILFGNHQIGVGWGNVLQEMIMNAYFAYYVKRSFVFYNYTWNMDGPDFSEYNGHPIPSRIPLSAIISGPIVGGPMGPNDVDVPRAISLDYFHQVCPNPYILRGESVKEGLGGNPPAKQLVAALLEKIDAIDARCIEIPRGSAQIFDYILFGSKGVLDVWPELSKSPIFTHFGWSPLIHSAYNANRHFFELTSPSLSSFYAPVSGHLPKIFSPMNPPSPPYPPLDGLLVVHIRRGDFDQHCKHFWTYSSEYNGFNSFPELPDHFIPPSRGATPENEEIYMKHCFPNVTQIVARVEDVRKRVASGAEGQGLKKIYIMTNGKRDWLAELKSALEDKGGWEGIETSRNVWLSWEQKPVAQALDMYVAQRAEAFIGNGFSSLTSNIVMLRMGVEGVGSSKTFFW